MLLSVLQNCCGPSEFAVNVRCTQTMLNTELVYSAVAVLLIKYTSSHPRADYAQAFPFRETAVRRLTHSAGGTAQHQVPPPAAAQRQVLRRSQRSTHNFPAACPRDNGGRRDSFQVHESFPETEFRPLISFCRSEGYAALRATLFREKSVHRY